MISFLQSPATPTAIMILIGGVWIFHGLYSKILNGIPRHGQIVARILGAKIARPATPIIGTLEIFLGGWALSGWQSIACAAVQTLAIISHERARDRLRPRATYLHFRDGNSQLRFPRPDLVFGHRSALNWDGEAIVIARKLGPIAPWWRRSAALRSHS